MSNQTISEQKIINGVDVEKMEETVQAAKENPEMVQFKFQSNNQWHSGSHNRTRVDSYYGTCRNIERERPFELDSDQPQILLGKDKGPNPFEYLLTALSSCLSTSLVFQASAEGIELGGIKSRSEGDIDFQGFLNLDSNKRKGYEKIRVQIKVKSNASSEKLKELVQNSPILDVIRNPTPVEVELVTE